MTTPGLLLLIGGIALAAPFLGLPGSWLRIVLALAGLAVLAIGFSLRSRAVASQAAEPPHDAPAA